MRKARRLSRQSVRWTRTLCGLLTFASGRIVLSQHCAERRQEAPLC